MKITRFILFFMALSGLVSGQEVMTVDRFQKLVAAPGDSKPLVQELGVLPFWPEAVVSNSLRYADGRAFNEVCRIQGKTVQGKYIISTMDSDYYKQPIHGIFTFDEKAKAYKQWGLFGKTLTESTVVYDLRKKIAAGMSSYEPGFKEISVGTFSDTESSEHTVTYKDGKLFLTRDSVTKAASTKE